MKTRLLAAVFVGCCLLLCGLILRRQIAAHPLPPENAERSEAGRGRFWMRMPGWQPASPADSALAHQTVVGQIAAIKAGDGPKAWSYGSRSLRQQFSSPVQLMQVIAGHYPEFLHPRSETYEPVFTDKSGQTAHAAILLEDGRGHQAWEDYLLVREDGKFKIRGVETLSGPDPGR